MTAAARLRTPWRPRITEKRFQAQVVALAKLHGWRSFHPYDSRRSAPGFPDLVLVRPPRLLFVELKAERGVATAAQAGWLRALHACGQEARLWRPSDWPLIEATLIGEGGE